MGDGGQPPHENGMGAHLPLASTPDHQHLMNSNSGIRGSSEGGEGEEARGGGEGGGGGGGGNPMQEMDPSAHIGAAKEEYF